ncbi:hypothetical protein NPIL_243391, partial [Nephila pilipes]
KKMSSSDEEIPKCERQSVEYEPHPCELIDLSIPATRDASSHSGEPSISSLLVNEGSPSDCQPVAPSALPDPESHANSTQEVQFQYYPTKDDLDPSAINSQWLIFARN